MAKPVPKSGVPVLTQVDPGNSLRRDMCFILILLLFCYALLQIVPLDPFGLISSTIEDES